MAKDLPACSAVFMRGHCPHGRLFEDEYKRFVLIDALNTCHDTVNSLATFFDRLVRTNRNRGTKILRCFPHCCPHHVDRTYCGSSLEVAVSLDPQSDVVQPAGRIGRNSRGPFDVANLFVFAHFEVLGGETLSAASQSLRYLRSISQSEATPEASWIEGVRQAPVNRHLLSDRLESATFLLNGQPHAKWNYHWESSANKVHRSTKHVLRAYVFFRTEGTQPTGSVAYCAEMEGSLKLVCILTSPPFTVVSYRRSPVEAALPSGRELGTLDMPHPAESDIERLVQQHISHASEQFGQLQQQDEQADEASRKSIALPGARTTEQIVRLQRQVNQELTPKGAGAALNQHTATQETRLVPANSQVGHRGRHVHWGDAGRTSLMLHEHEEIHLRDNAHMYTHPRTLGTSLRIPKPPASVRTPLDSISQDKSTAMLLRFKQQQGQLGSRQRELEQITDLTIVHFFMSRVTTSHTRGRANLEVVLAMAIGQHLHFGSIEALHLAKVLLSVAGDVEGGDVTRPRSADRTDFKLEELAFLLGEVCVWVVSRENVEMMQDLLKAYSPLLFSLPENGKDDLLRAFLNCTTRCWEALGRFLQTRSAQTSIGSVRKLSESILGVVFTHPKLEKLRPELRAVLQRPELLLVEGKGSSNRCSGPANYSLEGWRTFVAQVREGYLRDQDSRCGYPLRPTPGTATSWTAAWILQPTTLSVDTQSSSATLASLGFALPSVWTLCRALSQLLHLKIAVVGNAPHTLFVQAMPSLLPQGKAWLRLICDGRLRVAPVTPNGLTTLMCGSSYSFGGDYIAYPQQQGASSDDIPICLEFYWWPIVRVSNGSNTQYTAFRSVVTLATAASGGFIHVQVGLERGFVSHDMIAAALTPHMEMWSPAARLETVANWQPWLSIESVYRRK